jgi:crotonobetainyl-CoA:carnitine CoA-transferase CaiB-like acyl-CoA transferase
MEEHTPGAERTPGDGDRSAPRGRASLMGEHTAGALRGLRVIEIAQGWAGPLVGAMFADFGAEVIKVESVGRLDWWRGVAVGDDALVFERSALFNGINRNKLGVTLDLQSADGRSMLLSLVREADVFVENFTSHTMEKLNLTHRVLSAENPGLISISMPAFGSTGPWRDFPALGTTVESMCGVQSLTGYEGGPPRMQGTSWDPVIGLYASFAAMAAIHHRRLTGKGQHIEVSHIEAGTHFVAAPFLEYLLTGRIPRRRGNTSDVFAPHGCYPTQGEDEWITLVARSDREWCTLVAVLGDDPSLCHPDYATVRGRLARRDALDQAIGALTGQRARDGLFRELQAAGVPAAPVSTPPDLLGDEHLMARQFWTAVERAHVDTHLYPSRFLTMSRTPPSYDRPAPTLGQDNDMILSKHLGLSPDAIADLERRGIIGTSPQPGKR